MIEPASPPEPEPERARAPAPAAKWGIGLALALMGFGLLILRRPDVVTSPKLWAEDGAIFMKDAYLRHGYQTLLAPYSGTVLVVPRLWALFTTLLPVRYLPLSYALFTLAIDTASVAVILSRRFAWLIPSFAVRAALFLVLILLPGTGEIHGNLTNSIWYTGLCLLLLSFASDPLTRLGRVAEIVIGLLFAFTGAASVVIAPLYLLRWWRTRSWHSARLTVAVGAGGLFQLFELQFHPRTPAQLSGVGPWDFVRTMIERIGGTAALGEQRLGRWWPSSHTNHHAAALALAAALLLGVVVLARWVPRPARLALAAAIVLLAAAATVGVVGPFQQLNNPHFSGRYFVAPVAVLCLTIAAAAPAAWRRLSARVAWLLLLPVALLAFGVVGDARLPSLPPIGWAGSARCIASHHPCQVKLNPPGWSVELPPVRSAY